MKKEFINKSVGFLGASITEGGNYLYYVRSHILSEKDKCMIFNHGVGGSRAEMAIYTVEDEVLPIAPDYMFVEFGVNDLGIWLYDSFLIQNQELEESKKQRDDVYKKNMLAIADFLIKKGIKPIFMTPFAVNELLIETDDIETLADNKEKGEKITPAFYKRTTFERINKALENYSKWIKKVCKEKNIPVVDTFSKTYKAMRENEGMFTKDGIHYTETGGKFIAESVLEFLGCNKPFYFEHTKENDEYWVKEKTERFAQFFPWNFYHPMFGDYTDE